MKKVYTAFLLFLFGGTLAAQKADMQLFASKELSFVQPTFIGKVGSHYMVYDELSGWPSAIYTFDSAFHLVNRTLEYISAPRIKFHISGNAVSITWKKQDRDTLSVSIARLDEKGNELWFNRSKYYFSPRNSSPADLVTDVHGKYFLYYSLYTDPQNNDHLRAVLLDSAWNELKNGLYPLNYDSKLYTLAPLLVDASGNIHMAVYDKLGNYHLSSTLTMHTIPLKKDTLLSESFGLDKTKFYELTLTDDTAGQKVKLLGFYYDGQEKTKKGVADLRLPYERKNLITSEFHPFPEDFADALRSNLRYGRKQDDPTDNISMKEIFEKDGRLFVSTWLVDMPHYQLQLEKDMDKDEPVKQKKQPKKEENEYHPPTDNPALNGWLNNSANFNATRPVPLTVNPTTAGMQSSGSTSAVYGSMGQLSQFGSSSYGQGAVNNDPLFKRIAKEHRKLGQSLNAKKIVYFSVDEKSNYEYQVVPNTVSYNPGMTRLQNEPMVYNGQLFFLNDAVAKVAPKQTVAPHKIISVAKYNGAGVADPLSVFNLSNSYTFSKPIEVDPGRYVSAYYNRYANESGIAMWRLERGPEK
jgi:hypothetical protein